MVCSCSHIKVNNDPSRTLTLRRSFETALVKRFRWLKKLITQSIVQNDVFGLKIEYNTDNLDYISIPAFKSNEALGNEQYAFERDASKVALFMDWLRIQIDKGILEIIPGQQIGKAIETAWTNKYIQTAYQKGMTRGRQELNKKGYAAPSYEKTPGGLVGAFNRPFHVDRVGLVYTRTFESLKGITDEMSKQISVTLAQGIAEGRGPIAIAKQINERIDKIGITRAKILARTEVIRAHHVATIQEYENWGVVGVNVIAEWITAEDGRVCPDCARKARADQGYGPGVYTLKQIRGLIPFHPQCRCVAIPLDITDNEELQEKIKQAA